MGIIKDLNEEGPYQGGAVSKHARKSDGGVYLVVADETEEFSLALHYAAKMALAHRGHVGIMTVMDIPEFQHWGNIEEKMRDEIRQNNEQMLWELAKDVQEMTGLISVLYVREGGIVDSLHDLIEEDAQIKVLVLAGSTGSGGPGPLVSHFSNKGLTKLRVPVIIIPGHLDDAAIDDLI